MHVYFVLCVVCPSNYCWCLLTCVYIVEIVHVYFVLCVVCPYNYYCCLLTCVYIVEIVHVYFVLCSPRVRLECA